VSDKTNEKIPDIIESISPSAVMYLINAIYFYGTWKYEFDENDTEEKDFYLENGTSIKVAMMAQEADLNYTNNDLFSAVELPYGSEHYSMMVLLPEGQNKVKDVIDQLSPENWELWIENLAEQEVVVNLPKFKFMFEDSLNNELIDMGMGEAFSPIADFTKINSNGNLYISMVKQKAYIDVNEKGTEAAAVTVVEIELTSVGPDKKYFIVNKPFVFVIKEHDTNAIIFLGKVMDPVYMD
jgi:serpin B